MRASNIILLWTLHNVRNKNSPLFLFSLKLKLVCLAPFLLSRGPKLECCKLPKSWKTQGKIKSTLCYDNYITDITLRTSHYRHYGHYDCMTLIMVILFGEINATCIPILFKFITSKFSVLLTKHH